jgi:hypothetical protein
MAPARRPSPRDRRRTAHHQPRRIGDLEHDTQAVQLLVELARRNAAALGTPSRPLADATGFVAYGPRRQDRTDELLISRA